MTNSNHNNPQQQFTALLKRSDYFNSVMDSQRMALAQTVAILLKAMAQHDPSLVAPMCAALAEIETKTWESPSIDGDRSLFARSIRNQLQLVSG